MSRVEDIFKSFEGKKVIVLGDVMIDTYIEGTVDRISPEAPVPVVNFKTRSSRLGGAANVALNLKALGADPIICTIIGKDDEAENFMKLVNDAQLTPKGIIPFDDRVTTVKTRVIGNNQQLLRVDHEKAEAITSSAEFALLEKVKEFVEKDEAGVIVFQDYNKGVLTADLIEKTIAFANEAGVLTAVDPKKDNFELYKNVSLFKPNLKELREGTGVDVDMAKKETFLEAVEIIQNDMAPMNTFVTLSEHGVFICDKEEKHFIPAFPRQIADVSGAGDTVISVASLCLAADVDNKTLATLANLAGGLVCEQVGVVSVNKEDLMSEAITHLR
ncbi:MAG: bifunctional ADP-heptose synthase [Crocinitomicaceae bacterium]